MAEPVERTTALVAIGPGREAAVAASLGRALPSMGRFEERDGLLLARAAPHQLYAMRLGEDLPLMQELAAVSSGLIDLSDARTGLRLAGPGTRERLARLIPLDLHPGVFGPGQCAATLMAHLSVLLLQTGEEEYEIQCGRSFSGSFVRAVAAAGL